MSEKDALQRYKEMLDEGLEMKCDTCRWYHKIFYAEDKWFGNVLHSDCELWNHPVLIRFNFECTDYLKKKETDIGKDDRFPKRTM